ncbi:MAG: outer membrane beta-barrel protein [Crocinitomicaceae bacterium]
MKKLLSLFIIGLIALSANAQDRRFQMGLVTGATFNWIKVQTTEIERNGIGGGFTIGIGGNYLFNENIGLASGVQFDMESFKVNYGDAVTSSAPSGRVFYAYNDTEIGKYKDGIVEDFTDTTAFELLTRKYKAKYVTIPFFLKFQTNMIGQFKYYGKFGLRTSILAGVRYDDEGYQAAYNQGAATFERIGTSLISKDNMKPVTILKGLAPVRLGIGVYGGAEWNFVGNTFLYMEAGFNYGVTPALQMESSHLVNQRTSDGLYENLDVKNNPQHIIEIKLGLLF